VRSEAQLVSKVVNWVLRTLLLYLVSRSVDEDKRIIERNFWLLERARERERDGVGGNMGEGFVLSKLGILVAQLESIVHSGSVKPLQPLLCFDLLSDLLSTLDQESKVRSDCLYFHAW
jgi:hypothetical protein